MHVYILTSCLSEGPRAFATREAAAIAFDREYQILTRGGFPCELTRPVSVSADPHELIGNGKIEIGTIARPANPYAIHLTSAKLEDC